MDFRSDYFLFPIILHKNIKELTNNKVNNKRLIMQMVLNLFMLKNHQFLNMT